MDSFKQRVKKVTIFDDRLLQRTPTYAIQRGCQDMKMNIVPASSSNADNIQCLIQPSSYRTNVDKYISVSTDIFGWFNVQLTAGGAGDVAVGANIFTFGRDGAPCAFPLHNGCVKNIEVEINDQKFSIDSENVNKFIFRMMNSEKLSMERTCPSMLDKLACYNDGYATGSGINVLGTYYDSVPSDKICNGAYQIQFTDATGAVLTQNTALNNVAVYTTAYNYVAATNQIQTVADINAGQNAIFTVYYKLTTTEALICPPLAFDELFYKEASLFEIKNIQVDINIKNNVSVMRNISSANTAVNLASCIITSQGLNSSATQAVNTGAPFGNCRFISYFLTPPLDVQQPSECVVPWMEYLRTKTAGSANLAAGNTDTVQSAVIPLAGVQDFIVVSVTPSYNTASNKNPNAPYTEADWNLKINGIALDYGNKQTMLSTFLPMDFFKMSVQNGLQNMDWLQFSGLANTTQNGTTKQIPTVGSVIVLKPGVDFPLEEGGLCSGCPTRTTMQLTVNYTNQSAWPVNPVLNVISVNSGFVRFMNGESIIEKFPVSPAEVLSHGEIVPSMPLKRLVGAGVLNHSNTSILHKGHHHKHHQGGASHSAGSSPHSAGSSPHSAGKKKHSKTHSKKHASRRAYKE